MLLSVSAEASAPSWGTLATASRTVHWVSQHSHPNLLSKAQLMQILQCGSWEDSAVHCMKQVLPENKSMQHLVESSGQSAHEIQKPLRCSATVTS